jgi:hypothetical protein
MVWYGNRYGPERGFPRCSKFKLRVNRVRFSLGLMFGLGLGLGKASASYPGDMCCSRLARPLRGPRGLI